MRPGAVMTLATDWAEYAEWMLEHLEAHPQFINLAGPNQLAPPPKGWLTTNFERKGVRAGRAIHHLAYLRRAEHMNPSADLEACAFE